MEQRRPISELYAKLPKEKELANLEYAMHEVIDQLAEEVEGLRKYPSYLDIDTDLKDPLEGEEMRYCINVDLGMKLDEMGNLSKEDKDKITTNAAFMLRARLDKLRKDLEWKMTKAASDALK